MDRDLQSIQDARDAVGRAVTARDRLARFTQADVDAVVKEMAAGASRNAEYLARLAIEETGCGRYESKVRKNRFCSEEHHEFLKGLKTAGVIRRDEKRRVYEIAEPVGIVAAIIPMTNPTSTTIYKALIAVKARNPVIFSPHPRAARSIIETAKVMNDAAIAAGAPVGSIGWMESPTLEGTQELMRHPEVGIILATGGPGLVKAAYSSGKPAFGVGPGNVPAYIHESADIPAAARAILSSQRFDNSLICSSEQSLVIDASVRDAVLAEFRHQGAHLCDPDETRMLERLVARGGRLNAAIVGLDPWKLAEMAGFRVRKETPLLLAPAEGVGPEHPLSIEKLAPILAVYVEKDWQRACERCYEILGYGGMGHTLAIHARDEEVIWEFFRKKPAYRVLVNAPSSQGAVGEATHLDPSMTLGCGSAGNNITSDNITPMHLINIKRLAYLKKGYFPGEETGLSATEKPEPDRELQRVAASEAGSKTRDRSVTPPLQYPELGGDAVPSEPASGY